MKKILINLIVLLMFSTPSFANWVKVVSTANDDYYVDFERILKNDGYVYYWHLKDYLKPDKWGDLSVKVYTRGDCELFRYFELKSSYHTQPMGMGPYSTLATPSPQWQYPSPNSAAERILDKICSQ